MIKQVSPEFEQALTLALELSPVERLAMIEALAVSVQGAFATTADLDNTPLTPEEIAVLTQVEPLSPSEVIALGLVGTLPSLPDGAKWVDKQKRRRKERRQWPPHS